MCSPQTDCSNLMKINIFVSLLTLGPRPVLFDIHLTAKSRLKLLPLASIFASFGNEDHSFGTLCTMHRVQLSTAGARRQRRALFF